MSRRLSTLGDQENAIRHPTNVELSVGARKTKKRGLSVRAVPAAEDGRPSARRKPRGLSERRPAATRANGGGGSISRSMSTLDSHHLSHARRPRKMLSKHLGGARVVSSSSVAMSEPVKRPVQPSPSRPSSSLNDSSSGSESEEFKLLSSSPEQAVNDEATKCDDQATKCDDEATKCDDEARPKQIIEAKIGSLDYIRNWNPSNVVGGGTTSTNGESFAPVPSTVSASSSCSVKRFVLPEIPAYDELRNGIKAGVARVAHRPNPLSPVVEEVVAPRRTHLSPPPHERRRARAPSPDSASSSDASVREPNALLASHKVMKVSGVEYVKLGVLGKGGSSKVYKVLEPKSGSVFALKKISLKNGTTSGIAQFQNEIRTLERLKGNPSIVQLVASEVVKDDAVFLVMEAGEIDLHQLLAAQRRGGSDRLLEPNFLRLTWQSMLTAVHAIHEERIVHGDLKPANFLFVRGRIKLIDFGIAKTIHGNTTNIQRESQVGTLNYMSPEAILDTSGCGGAFVRSSSSSSNKPTGVMKLGRKSDVWSMGCILYQMLYGKTPFSDLKLVQKLHAITSDDSRIRYPPLDPTVGDERLLRLLKRCLSFRPEDRPSIVELLEDPYLHPHQQEDRSEEVAAMRLEFKTKIVVVVDLMLEASAPDLDGSELDSLRMSVLKLIAEKSDGDEIKRAVRDVLRKRRAKLAARAAANPPIRVLFDPSELSANRLKETSASNHTRRSTEDPNSAKELLENVLSVRANLKPVSQKKRSSRRSSLSSMPSPAVKNLEYVLKKGLRTKFKATNQERRVLFSTANKLDDSSATGEWELS